MTAEGTGFSETWLEDEYDYGITPYITKGQ
jgi:hypothetical protein